jgi:hypothetical protein
MIYYHYSLDGIVLLHSELVLHTTFLQSTHVCMKHDITRSG